MDCKRKWVKSEEILPEGMRRLLPPPPPEMRLVLAGQAELPVDPSDVAAFNAAMAAHWESTSLMKCPACTGCFRPKHYMEVRESLLSIFPMPDNSLYFARFYMGHDRLTFILLCLHCQHHHRICQADDNLPEDTTISLGSVVSSVLTPPITQDHGRPMLVPELSLGANLMNNGKSKHQAAAVKKKTPTKPHLKEHHKAYPAKHGQGQAGSVKSTLMQAAAALESVDSKLSKSSYKEKPKQTKAHAASSGPTRTLKTTAAPARDKTKGRKFYSGQQQAYFCFWVWPQQHNDVHMLPLWGAAALSWLSCPRWAVLSQVAELAEDSIDTCAIAAESGEAATQQASANSTKGSC